MRLKLTTGVLLIVSPFLRAADFDFDREVRPILVEHCFHCHGPDAAQRKADLRLDTSTGERDVSELLSRISSTDPKRQMPPPSAGTQLTSGQKEILLRWIESGAKQPRHWSFLPPVKPVVPAVEGESWCRNEIDHFILQRLEQNGQRPSDTADRRSFIRRVSFDLTGLAPSPNEIEAFVNDRSPRAYDLLINRLLQSDRFGERLAVDWMDVARYADTSGYQYDIPRTMWMWRSWVIQAFNSGMPYDRFIRLQLAGDLLPNAGVAEKIATGFNRNHGFTVEGGVIAEEYRLQYVADRVTTMGTAFLGLTLECARCHDHKYDPISQRDFYQLSAFFNRLDESGLVDPTKGYSDPVLLLPSSAQARRMGELQQALQLVHARYHQPDPVADAKQAQWARDRKSPWISLPSTAPFNLGLGIHSRRFRFKIPDGNAATAIRLQVFARTTDQSRSAKIVAGMNRIEFSRIETADDATVLLDRIAADVPPGSNLVRQLTDEETSTSISIPNKIGRVLICLPEAKLVGATEVEIEFTCVGDCEITLAFSYSILPAPLRHDRTGRLSELITGGPARAALDAGYELRHAFRGNHLKAYRPILTEFIRLSREAERLRHAAPATMIMRDAVDRTTHLLKRGQYDQPGDEVVASTPAHLPPLPANAPTNRLGLAQWLTARENPLVARVVVNRYWQQLFGQGLVRTPEDFGVQGQRPTHPLLLDWLAVDFMENGWNVKRLLRQICRSNTYRQSSHFRDANDPENRLLARYPARRLSAESIRDHALAVSGLLVESIGGPSVKPRQPEGLWSQLTTYRKFRAKYEPDTGDDLYRRSLYTYWKRASHHPVMAVFDAPNRETCTVRRPQTNTPLQALTLLNEPQFVEAARALAVRMLSEAEFGDDARGRIARAFQWATSRPPEKLELYALLQLLAVPPDPSIHKRLKAIGTSKIPAEIPPAELAAYTMVARAILNLSETISQP